MNHPMCLPLLQSQFAIMCIRVFPLNFQDCLAARIPGVGRARWRSPARGRSRGAAVVGTDRSKALGLVIRSMRAAPRTRGFIWGRADLWRVRSGAAECGLRQSAPVCPEGEHTERAKPRSVPRDIMRWSYLMVDAVCRRVVMSGTRAARTLTTLGAVGPRSGVRCEPHQGRRQHASMSARR